jgi:hypothetical protein
MAVVCLYIGRSEEIWFMAKYKLISLYNMCLILQIYFCY